jgi:hypothetical protein
LSIIQGPFSVAPCQTLISRFATFPSLYLSRHLSHCVSHLCGLQDATPTADPDGTTHAAAELLPPSLASPLPRTRSRLLDHLLTNVVMGDEESELGSRGHSTIESDVSVQVRRASKRRHGY